MEYACCKRLGKGCRFKLDHDFEASAARLKLWFDNLSALPQPSALKPKRVAVALDCEMVGVGEVGENESELARLSAVDYFSGETLIDRFIHPADTVRDWRTRYSGVSARIFAQAKATGEIFCGWEAARAALFEFVDADTILIGHTLVQDLKVLRLKHERIIDISILLRKASFERAPGTGLKSATKAFLGKDIQNRGPDGHDSLEDALSTRDVLMFCMASPAALLAWGRQKWADEKRARRKQRLADLMTNVEKKLIKDMSYDKDDPKAFQAPVWLPDYSEEPVWELLEDENGYW